MEQKKKFRFNIVDALVLIIILAAAAFFLWKTTGKDGNGDKASNVTIRYVVEVSGMDTELYAEVEKLLPFTMVASGNEVDGTVVSCTGEPCTVAYMEVQSPVNAAQSQWVLPNEDDSFVTARFVCEAVVDAGTNLNQVGTQEIRIGRSHYIKGLDVELVGTIISMERVG